MTNEDELRHSIDCSVSTEELIKRIKSVIAQSKKEKEKRTSYVPLISWEKLLQTKLINKPKL